MKYAVNLLNYPALERQRRWRHRWTTSLAGGMVGVMLAWAVLQWVDVHQEQVQQQHQRLQAMLDAQKKQRQSLQKQQAEHGVWQQQVLHLHGVAQQHKAWELLHQALQREAGEGALQLLSLQLAQGRLSLHGRTTDLQGMNQARMRISHDLGLELKLSSALILPEPSVRSPSQAPARVEFVWQGDWPLLRPQAEKTMVAPSGPMSPKS